jgi:hypothetical protein
MTEKRVGAIWWAVTVMLVAVWVVRCAWVLRDGILDTWRFWTALSLVTSTRPNPLHTGLDLAIAALWLALVGVGVMIGAPRRRLLVPLIFASSTFDLCLRQSGRDGPTVFFFLMWLLILFGAIAGREDRREGDARASEQADAAGDHRAGNESRDARS